MTKMSEEQILMHAEVRANLHAEGERPTGADFGQAEHEVREMLADGAAYDEEFGGWVWPAST